MVRGVIFQSDGKSTLGRIFIRPLEAVDRFVAGALPRPGEPKLAMHAGIHVVLADGAEYVAEQLIGTWRLTFSNGLNWTPLAAFEKRNRGGWSVTVPPEAFRAVGDRVADDTVLRLNSIEGRPFVTEDCTGFVERAFGGRRMFADSPLLQWLGIAARIGDPALPLLRADARLDAFARRALQFERIVNLPDAQASAEMSMAWRWLHRLAPIVVTGGLLYSSASRRSTPRSSTARKFLR